MILRLRRCRIRKSRLWLFGVFVVVMVILWVWLAERSEPVHQPDNKTLRVVMLGSPNETLNYGNAQTYYPWAIVGNVCDVLVGWRQGRLHYQLATAIEPNADATQWTVRLRSGVKFSDGSTLSSADVLASLYFLAQSVGFGSFFQDIDFNASQVIDAQTLLLQLKHARADLVLSVLAAASVVWKAGKGDATRPVCSGPYQVTAFDAHRGARLSRNAYAWQPAAYFEHIDILPVADSSARVNALLSGAAQYAFDISTSSARALEQHQGFSIQRSGTEGSSAYYFVLNTRVKPFDDLALRQAMKAVVNRQLLVDRVLDGYGHPGNDLFGQGLPGENTWAWPVTPNQEDARRVFREKGVTQVTMLTADLTPGLNNAAELLRQQLADIGVTLQIEQINPADYLSDLSRLHQSPLLAMFALNRPFIATIPIFFGQDNPFNYGGWYPQSVADGVEQLRTTTDPVRQLGIIKQLQAQIHQDGPYLVWGYRDQLSGSVAALQDVVLSQGIPLFGSARLVDNGAAGRN